MSAILNRIATSLNRSMVDSGVRKPASVPVIIYALHIIFNTAAIVILALTLGVISGKLGSTALTLASFATLRYVSGGYHLKSGVACVIVSTAIVVAIPHVEIGAMWAYALTAMALVITAVRAPNNYDKYARIPKRFYPLLKFIACVVIAVNFAVVSETLAITYIVQALLLLGGEKTNDET